MVELTIKLDTIFSSLADATRRDILKRVLQNDLTISQIAKPYRMSFAAIAKHVAVLEKAQLISKRRNGKEQIISASPKTIAVASEYLKKYELLWNDRFDRLEQVLHNN